MSDEKKFDESTSVDNTEETVEVTSEETTETVETATENSLEETAETAAEETNESADSAEEAAQEAVGEFIAADSAESALGDNENTIDGVISENIDTEAVEAVLDDADEENKTSKKLSAPAIIAIAAVVVIIAALVCIFLKFGPQWFNKYNRKYIDVTGKTIEDVSDELGMTLDEFLEEFDLPKNMPANTYETAAYYTIPFKTYVEKSLGSDVETIKEEFDITDDISDDATYVEVMDKVALKYLVPSNKLDQFKENYGFGDDITEDTLWGEVRQTIDEKSRADRLEADKAEKADSEQNSDDDMISEEDTNSEETTDAE